MLKMRVPDSFITNLIRTLPTRTRYMSGEPRSFRMSSPEKFPLSMCSTTMRTFCRRSASSRARNLSIVCMQTFERLYDVTNWHSLFVNLGEIRDGLPHALVAPFINWRDAEDRLGASDDQKRSSFSDMGNVSL